MKTYLTNISKKIEALGRPVFFVALLFFVLGCSPKGSSNSKPIVKDGMVLVPSGTFQMGSEGQFAREDESPIHRVVVDAFWMDQTEVTNAQFKAFVEANLLHEIGILLKTPLLPIFLNVTNCSMYCKYCKNTLDN